MLWQRKVLEEVAVVAKLLRLREGGLAVEVEFGCARQHRFAPAQKLLNAVARRHDDFNATVERDGGEPQCIRWSGQRATRHE